MRILHICLCSPYTDGFGYQENEISSVQAERGNEVMLIAPNVSWNSDGKLECLPEGEYTDEFGVKIVRMMPEFAKNIFSVTKIYPKLYAAIENFSPDVIFVHNLQFLDIATIAKYRKHHPNVVVFADNHADFTNSAKTLPKKLFYKLVWRSRIKTYAEYIDKFYGVTSGRVEFLINVFGAPTDKCKLLPMGVDESMFDSIHDIREKYGIPKDSFLIVSGGKFDAYKTKTVELARAVSKLKPSNVKLLLFGSVDESIKAEFDLLVDNESVYFVGWLDKLDALCAFASADLAAFCGRHSVYWEVCAALGIPMICKSQVGFDHIDIGGNVEFFPCECDDEITAVINSLYDGRQKSEKYFNMKAAAMSDTRKRFWYGDIAYEIEQDRKECVAASNT